MHSNGTGVQHYLHLTPALLYVLAKKKQQKSSKATQSFLSECTRTLQQAERRGRWMTQCTCESLSSLSQQILGPEFVISGEAKPRF